MKVATIYSSDIVSSSELQRKGGLTNAQLIILSNCEESTISLARDGMTAWPENCNIISNIYHRKEWLCLTPPMNNPNAIPNSPMPPILKRVSAGAQRLPGLSRFENPSTKRTIIINIVETMPIIEAYDSRDSGRNTVGINLCKRRSVGWTWCTKFKVHIRSPQSLYVLTEYDGSIACKESAYNVTRMTLHGL